MFPIRTQHRLRIFPFITHLFILINVAVFGYMFTLDNRSLLSFIDSYAVIPKNLIETHEWQASITSLFIHGGVLHLVSNMLFLYIFGPSLEERFDHLPYFIFYLISGIISVVSQSAVNPTSSIPMIGASGAISGILGSYVMLFPERKVELFVPTFWFMGTVAVPAGIMLLYWFATQYFLGIDSLDQSEAGGIAYFAHLGGFVAGLLLTPIFARRKLNQRNQTDIA